MSDESRSDEFEMPPELNALENSLRELPLPSNSVVDRDELMFQSGWAAALATRDANTAPNSASAARWVWPTLTGTFATLSAALAIRHITVKIKRHQVPCIGEFIGRLAGRFQRRLGQPESG